MSHTAGYHPLTEKELARISELIYARAGIVLSAQKRDMVFNRLSRRLRELNLTHFSRYISLLESDPTSPEWQRFVNALTTNLTSFFREAYHFPVLAQHARSRPGGYSVWCAAASTGEEPWSVAITLEEALGRSITGPRVLGTDIDTDVLQKARRGVYRSSEIATLTEQQKRDWFLRGTGKQQDQVKIKNEHLSSVLFRQLNLIDSRWDLPAPFDAIFCRNVMIYFDRKTQEELMLRFARLLKPGGLLFVGHSEHFSNMHVPFRLQGQSVYCLAEKG